MSVTQGDSVRALLAARLSRPLSAANVCRMDVAVAEAPSVLSAGGEDGKS